MAQGLGLRVVVINDAVSISAILQDVSGATGTNGRYTRFMINELTRITADPQVMGGRPCIRGLRVTVGTVVGLLASGHLEEEVLRMYPYLETDDIREALAYAAWRSDEFEVPLAK